MRRLLCHPSNHDHGQLKMHTPAGIIPDYWPWITARSEEHTSELQSLTNLVCRLLLEKKKNKQKLHAETIDRITRRHNNEFHYVGIREQMQRVDLVEQTPQHAAGITMHSIHRLVQTL